MFVLSKFGYVLGAMIVLRCFTLLNGISVYQDKKLLSEDEKRGGVIFEPTNEILSSKNNALSAKSKTAKRGIVPLEGNKRHFGGSGPPGYGDYEPGRYGGSGGGYPHSGGGHFGDDRGPPLYEPDDGYHHGGSGGGYIGGRPSGYGHSYGPSYGPPHGPVYHGGYEDDHHYHDHGGGGGDQGIGGFKALTLKKILLPLAGLAILGVAAAASQNPVLLQLGTLNGRRKRDLPSIAVYPYNPNVKRIKTD